MFVKLTGLCLEWVLLMWTMSLCPMDVEEVTFVHCTIIATQLVKFATWASQQRSQGFRLFEFVNCIFISVEGMTNDGSDEVWANAGLMSINAERLDAQGVHGELVPLVFKVLMH
ncbi:hypothetical protein BKA62DRAFT_690719 [Auriculariales sp. MPI-PUGE-AT-0066]|nr:hypothetical protein BKA62DRAFT_733264 [Auriculariales sp. MPI-PUGE-AT-0066]KAH7100408.1 hypothetical protein BKA62DRAFT_706200 [Auriculariales sp. MPI-PUGE-AT-0066]KAH7105732.1 hypothetical protein BKA62DRAFT_690719 [Auriculariales sp. MPI-PUGE-AT-0066]